MHDAEPALRSLAASARVLLLGVAVGMALWLLSDVLLLAFFAALLAIGFRGVSTRLARRLRVPDGAGLGLVAALAIAAIVAVAFAAGPEIVRQAESLYDHLSRQVAFLEDTYGRTGIGRWIFSELHSGGRIGGTGALSSAAGSTVQTVTAGLVLLATTLYFAIAPGIYVGGIVRVLPPAARPAGRRVLERAGAVLWWWLLGQFTDMLAVGVLATIGLAVIGVPLPFVLGLLAGLLTFIPYFGALASAVPAILLGMTVSGPTAIEAAGVFVLCHMVEGYAIAPLVQRRMVRLPPALTILSLSLFGALFGPLGIILATPLAATMLAVVQQAWLVETLGEDTERSTPAVGSR